MKALEPDIEQGYFERRNFERRCYAKARELLAAINPSEADIELLALNIMEKDSEQAVIKRQQFHLVKT